MQQHKLFITFDFIIIKNAHLGFHNHHIQRSQYDFYKPHIFENVLLSTRRRHGRKIMNVFGKLKLSCTCSNSTSLPTTHPWNKAWVKPAPVQTSPAHASYAQQFLSVNVLNRPVFKSTNFTFNNSTFCPHSLFVFCKNLRTNSDYFPIQH
jgi:hypothetical protein